MGARESVTFDFLSHGASGLASDFKRTGDSAALAAKGARLLSDALEQQRKTTDILAGGTLALAKADKILADAEHVLADGALEAELALKKEAGAAQQARDAAAEAAAGMSSLAGTGGIGGGGLGAVIGAGVALSPVILTLAAGFGGLGLAAAGLRKNLAMSPELAQLKQEYQGFEQSLKPVVLKDFAGAVHLAGNVLGDLQPVAKATGGALGGVIGEIDATLKDREWQGFWQFMGRTAPGDVRLLGDAFSNLTGALPSLLEQLQPTAAELLQITDDAAKLIRLTSNVTHEVNTLGGATKSTNPVIHGLGEAWQFAAKWGNAQADLVRGVTFGLDKLAGSQKTAIPLTQGLSHQVQQWANAQGAINNALSNGLTPLENYIGATITERNDLKQVNDALKASGDRIGYKTQKERDSFSAVQQYIQNTVSQAQAAVSAHKGIDAEISSIQNALPRLENVKGKTKEYRDELQQLYGILHKLQQQRDIYERIHFTGYGKTIFPGVTHAAGTLVPPGFPNDTYPALLTSGETVVPRSLTPAVAPLMKAAGVPGFAAGGLVPDFTGSLPGLLKWEPGAVTGLKQAIGQSIALSLQHELRSGSGGTPGNVSALQNAAAAMFPAYGWGLAQLAPLIALWNQESGWRWNATNPSSGAYGIPQALPPGKMASAGADWLTNPVTQIRWGESYIAGRYGTPAAAEMHEVAYGWYDHGGWLPKGLSLALNTTGRPERVGGGDTYITVNVKVGHGTSPREAAREIADILNQGAMAGIKLRKSIIAPNG